MAAVVVLLPWEPKKRAILPACQMKSKHYEKKDTSQKGENFFLQLPCKVLFYPLKLTEFSSHGKNFF